MASIITHGVVGAAMSATYALTVKPMPKRFWILSVILAILPDADALGFKLGVPYESFFGHRGFSHSLIFALLMGLLTVFFFFRTVPLLSRQWWLLAGYFFLVTASHAALDAMTTGGLGVALLSPFDLSRIFFPWRPIRVSPIGIREFFGSWGLRVIISEITWVWIPSLALVFCAWLLRLFRTPPPQTPTT
jgi:inner membrane protein